MTWLGWEKLGGTLTSGPAVSSWASGRLDTFVRGTNSALWHKWYQGGWSGWENLGGVLTSIAPSIWLLIAARTLQGAVAMAPGAADAHLQLGLALRATGRLDEAGRHLAEAVRLSGSPDAHRALDELAAEIERRRH